MPKLSIVIPTLNNVEYTAICVGSILNNTTSDYEIIFVDDCSTDGTRALLRNFPSATVWFNPEPRGVTANWNKGIELSKGEYVAIINNDIVLTKDWDTPLINALNDDTWVASPFHTEHALPTDFPNGTTRHDNGGFPLLGCCFLTKRSLYDTIGMFPAELVMWFNDNWLVDTVSNKYKKQLVHVKESYCHHYYSKTISQVPNLVAITNKDAETFNTLKHRDAQA
jgi:glycosyltransferase involved in cell wall biosynthesis